MGVDQRIRSNQKASGTLGVTGAAPQTVSDTASQHFVNMVNVESGTLSANVTVQATTSSLTISAKWQVADAGTLTWVDCAAQPNAPANVVLVTGTGSAVASTLNIPAPVGVYGKRYARLVFVSAGATGGGTGGGDQVSVGYNYRLPSPFTS